MNTKRIPKGARATRTQLMMEYHAARSDAVQDALVELDSRAFEIPYDGAVHFDQDWSAEKVMDEIERITK